VVIDSLSKRFEPERTAGVVDEHVQPSQLPREGFDTLPFRHVEGDSPAANFGGKGCDAVETPCPDNDVEPGRGEHPRGRSANARTGARHSRNGA
jgi:hypothetical protein